MVVHIYTCACILSAHAVCPGAFLSLYLHPIPICLHHLSLSLPVPLVEICVYVGTYI